MWHTLKKMAVIASCHFMSLSLALLFNIHITKMLNLFLSKAVKNVRLLVLKFI